MVRSTRWIPIMTDLLSPGRNSYASSPVTSEATFPFPLGRLGLADRLSDMGGD